MDIRKNDNDSLEQHAKNKNNEDKKEPQPRDTCFELGTDGSWQICCCDDEGEKCSCTGIM
ncbi:hypothetical protein ACTWQL_22345 [Pseudalkalibacillus sp. R45]|uniref:hypothetical protein n=1 Tax=Pseudalkalibacillus sp. R45 TaxID=3457433 RepID=UPI003FCE60B8